MLVKTYRFIIRWITFVTFLKIAVTYPVFQSEVNWFKLYEVSSNIFRGSISSCRNSYNIRGCKLSGPGDFATLRLFVTDFAKFYMQIRNVMDSTSGVSVDSHTALALSANRLHGRPK